HLLGPSQPRSHCPDSLWSGSHRAGSRWSSSLWSGSRRSGQPRSGSRRSGQRPSDPRFSASLALLLYILTLCTVDVREEFPPSPRDCGHFLKHRAIQIASALGLSGPPPIEEAAASPSRLCDLLQRYWLAASHLCPGG